MEHKACSEIDLIKKIQQFLQSEKLQNNFSEYNKCTDISIEIQLNFWNLLKLIAQCDIDRILGSWNSFLNLLNGSDS